MIRVLVVDDHPLIREGVAALLDDQEDMMLVGEASNGKEAIELFRSLEPDVTLMDIQMPSVNGTQAIATIVADKPDARIIVLTTYAGEAQAARALKAGAKGYLLKSSLRKEMLDVIRAVHAGRKHIDREIAERLLFHGGGNPLGEREITVLRLVAIGRSNRQIAAELGISEETVKTHLKSVFAKLAVTDRTHAVTEALRRGIIEI
jgi:DNA-binding NarL/FixJ family response regulator